MEQEVKADYVYNDLQQAVEQLLMYKQEANMGLGKEQWDRVEEEIHGGGMFLPPYVANEIKGDFKHFLISLSRYKFAGKLLEGKNSMLEVGCHTGFKTMMFSQFVEYVTGIDYEENAIKFAKENYADDKRSFLCADFLNMPPVEHKVDAVVSLDVIEHIEKENENKFMEAVVSNLTGNGIVVIGTPNITASEYQSKISRIGHINMYDHKRLKNLTEQYFENVFMFGMNDEVVHTGFLPMAHYLFAVGAGIRNS